MTQIRKGPKLKNDPNSKMTQFPKWPKFKNDPNSKITQNQKWPKTNNVPNSKMTQNYIKKWCNGHARRRRAGRRLVRFAFARPSSLFCVPVLFLFLYLLWVYVFYGFYVGPAKLQRGATPPSVMVLLEAIIILGWNFIITGQLLKVLSFISCGQLAIHWCYHQQLVTLSNVHVVPGS